MKFCVLFGVPEVAAFWKELYRKHREGALRGNDIILFKKLVKVLLLLEENPRHNSLQSHEIAPLSERYGQKVFQSYLENNTPSAGRIFWTYGSGQREITIVGIEPHPESKKSRGYDKVRLSSMP